MSNISFYLSFENVEWVRKSGILIYRPINGKLMVQKVYRPTTWRKFLDKIGFSVRMNQVKVIFLSDYRNNYPKKYVKFLQSCR